MSNSNYDDLIPNEAVSDRFVGFNHGKLPLLESHVCVQKERDEGFIVLKKIFTHQECLTLREFFNNNKKVKTTSETVKVHYGSSETGIQRSCFYDKPWSTVLFERIKHHFQTIEVKNEQNYLLIGLNPLIRFIHYNKANHRLIPHYDKEIKVGANVITIKTIVVYLNDCESGHTNILKDTRQKDKVEDSFDSYPVIYSQKPIEGSAIIFDHNVFHEGAKLIQDNEKLILTTELCYTQTEK